MIRDIVNKFQQRFRQKENKKPRYRTVICAANGSRTEGSPWADEKRKLVYHQLFGSGSVGKAICEDITPELGLGCYVEPDNFGLNWRVIQDDTFLRYSATDNRNYQTVSPADLQPGGRLFTWLQSKAMLPLATRPQATGLFVDVTDGYYPLGGVKKYFGGYIGLALTQNPNPGEHYLAGLYLDASNALQVVYGASVATSLTPPEPVWPDDTFSLSAVRVNDTQTRILFLSDDDGDNDVFDRRLNWGDLGGGGGVWPAPDTLNIGAVEYSTLTAAIAAAVSGDTIYAGVGTFTCNDLTLPSGVDLVGADRKATIFTTSTELTTLTLGGSNHVANITISITTSAAADTKALRINTDNSEVINCKILSSNAGAGDSVGVYADSAAVHTNWVLRCYIESDYIGVVATSASQLLLYVQQCFISGPTASISMASNALVQCDASFVIGAISVPTGNNLRGLFQDEDGTVFLRGASPKIEQYELSSAPGTNPYTGHWYSYFLPDGPYVEDDTGAIHKVWLKNDVTVNNLLYHAMHHADWQEGTTFNDVGDATTYVGTLWLALQNGQTPDITGLAGGATSDYAMACKTTMDSAASQNGFVQFLSNEDTIGLRGKTLSVSAELWGTNVGNLALNVLVWTGTADSPTKDVVGTWNNGSAHTLAANWAFGATSVAIAIGGSEGTRYKTEAITIPTNANNLAVFVSTWDNEASGDIWQFADVQLEIGTVATQFVRSSLQDEINKAAFYFYKSYNLTVAPGTVSNAGVTVWQTRAAVAASTAGQLYPGPFRWPKQFKAPTITLYSNATGTANAIYNASVGNDRTGATVATASPGSIDAINISNASANAIALDAILAYQFVADARF